jgi:hypothetical protein
LSVIFFISWVICRAGSKLAESFTRVRSVLEATRVQSFGLQKDLPPNMRRHRSGGPMTCTGRHPYRLLKMDDFEELVGDLKAGAERRGLRFLDATFPGDPAVIFHHGAISIDDVLDIAQHSFAPFLSLGVTRLDPSDLMDTWDPDEDGEQAPPAELMGRWQERAGEIDGVILQWIASGAVYLYLAVPAWKQELEELRDNWSEELDAQRTDLRMAYRIRITHLAEQIERAPEFRAGNNQTREAIGKALLEPMLQSDEGGPVSYLVLKEAGRQVRANAQAEYAKLLGEMDQLAAELRMTRQWLRAKRASDRTSEARNFLMQRSGGYAPSGTMVNELRRRAEK